MKRKYVAVMTTVLCLGLLAGCQETPENTIVREKGADNVKEYDSAENSEGEGNALREALNVPEHYKNEETYENGALVIDTDAEVIVPDAASMNTYSVSAKEVNQDMIDQVTQAFFEEGDKFYNGHSYFDWTKEDYQERITRLKKYKAEGNLDPYDHGMDENGELQFHIDEVIANYEENMKNAPDEVKKEEVTPSFGLKYESEKEKGVDEDCFLGAAETKNGNYYYNISYGLNPDISFKISKIREDDIDPQEFTSWHEGEYFLEGESIDRKPFSEDFAKKFIHISREDAEKMAVEKVEKLGWGLKVHHWDYVLYYHGEGGLNEDSVLDGGYLFQFTRELDGVPVTYTSSYGGALEDMDSTLVPWSYERCDIIVTNNGIEQVEIYNPYEMGEIQTKNVKMMSFDEISKIYEQMMEVSNADISKYEDKRTYHIKKIVLGYSRIYDPVTDNDTGLMVPVWDFFGGFDCKGEGYDDKDGGERSTQSYMTINAIDGTVIDREVGY